MNCEYKKIKAAKNLLILTMYEKIRKHKHAERWWRIRSHVHFEYNFTRKTFSTRLLWIFRHAVIIRPFLFETQRAKKKNKIYVFVSLEMKMKEDGWRESIVSM